MKIQNISEKEYNNFALENKQDHFLHSIEWGNTRKKINWDYEVIGFYKDDSLKAAAIVMFKKFPYVNKYYAYTSRGFIANYEDKELLDSFTNELRKYLKQKNVVSFTIDPDITLNILDDEYQVVETFESSKRIMDNLSSVGYEHQGFLNNFEGIQPRHTFRIDIANLSKEDLLKKMHRSTRYSINLVSKSDLNVEYKTKDNLDEFMKLMEETTNRDGFTSRDISYYQNIMDEFGDDIKLIFVSIEPAKVLKAHEDQLADIQKEISDIVGDGNIDDLGKKAKSKIKEKSTQEEKIKEKIEKLKPYMQHDKLNLATAFLITYNNKAWYAYGASSDHLREYRPTYLIYKTMIDYCYDNNMEFLDLFGVGGELNPDSHIHGLYVIKKGFGGDLHEFIGEYDLVINKFYYSMFKSLFPKIKSLRKKLKR